MSEPRPLHRLFGLCWIDFFQDAGVRVETEMDLSVKQQFIDLVLIRSGPEPIPQPLPDGFEELAAHNLLTFKSHQEALDGWALCELIGHYVNYRKQASPSQQDLLPESDFRLFAVCARYPHNLAQQVMLAPIRQGVYKVRAATLVIRVVVLHQLPQEEHNAMLHLFSAREELLRYGQQHYRPRSHDTSTLLYQLFQAYGEDTNMSAKLKEFVRQSKDAFLAAMSVEELRQRLSIAERLEGLPPEERVKGLPPEERVKGLPPEERLKGLSAEEVVNALSPEVLEALARQLKAKGSSSGD